MRSDSNREDACNSQNSIWEQGSRRKEMEKARENSRTRCSACQTQERREKCPSAEARARPEGCTACQKTLALERRPFCCPKNEPDRRSIRKRKRQQKRFQGFTRECTKLNTQLKNAGVLHRTIKVQTSANYYSVSQTFGKKMRRPYFLLLFLYLFTLCLAQDVCLFSFLYSVSSFHLLAWPVCAPLSHFLCFSATLFRLLPILFRCCKTMSF